MGVMREYVRLYLALSAIFFILFGLGIIGVGIYGETPVAKGLVTLGVTGILVISVLGCILSECHHLFIPVEEEAVGRSDFFVVLQDLTPDAIQVEPIAVPAQQVAPINTVASSLRPIATSVPIEQEVVRGSVGLKHG